MIMGGKGLKTGRRFFTSAVNMATAYAYASSVLTSMPPTWSIAIAVWEKCYDYADFEVRKSHFRVIFNSMVLANEHLVLVSALKRLVHVSSCCCCPSICLPVNSEETP